MSACEFAAFTVLTEICTLQTSRKMSACETAPPFRDTYPALHQAFKLIHLLDELLKIRAFGNLNWSCLNCDEFRRLP